MKNQGHCDIGTCSLLFSPIGPSQRLEAKGNIVDSRELANVRKQFLSHDALFRSGIIRYNGLCSMKSRNLLCKCENDICFSPGLIVLIIPRPVCKTEGGY